MISRIYSAGLFGIDGFLVTVECSAWDRIPAFELVGLPDAAVKEAKNRVRSACENSGFVFPPLDLCVNLAPASMKKEGTAFDLAILTSVLQCQGILPHAMDFSDKMLIGELSLSGEVRRVDGVLPMCVCARDAGKKEIYVPMENVAEASVVDGIDVYGVTSFRALVNHFLGKEPIEKSPKGFDPRRLSLREGEEDFSDVRGQLKAKRAMEIAAAGGHNILMIGPPGSGKSMLAKRLGSILPDMTFEEAITATKIHSVMGTLKTDIICTRPFRSPHHTVTPIGMIGGGAKAQPGEISLAQSGVLFLDELPEFPKKVTESLRQPLEDGCVTITRAAAKMTYPSRFTLVCAMNPCRCGYFGDPNKQCTCSPASVRKYLDRISGPLLDRMDLIIELPSVSYDDISGSTPKGESSASIRTRVNAARAFAAKRLRSAGDDPSVLNGAMSPAQLQRHCVPTEDAKELMREAFDSLGLSARGHDRILRVARTIADLDGAAEIGADHIGEAIMYRSLDRKYWKR